MSSGSCMSPLRSTVSEAIQARVPLKLNASAIGLSETVRAWPPLYAIHSVRINKSPLWPFRLIAKRVRVVIKAFQITVGVAEVMGQLVDDGLSDFGHELAR
jgi:hypothetical protein